MLGGQRVRRRWKAVGRHWRCMGMGEGKSQQGGGPRKSVWRRLPRAPAPEVAAADGDVPWGGGGGVGQQQQIANQRLGARSWPSVAGFGRYRPTALPVVQYQ